jgi:hypothetical protein
MIERRKFLAVTSVGALTGIMFPLAVEAAASNPVKRLVLVHGRDQQGNDPHLLQSQWIAALQRGANSLGRQLPQPLDVSFPYYGDILDKFASTLSIPLTTDIQARGDDLADRDFLEFEAAVADQLRQGAGISIDDVNAEYGTNPEPRGPENWKWVRAMIRALDIHGGSVSSQSIEIFMRDVYLYTNRAGIRDQIDRIVGAALTEEPSIIVAHSLGSVVAYNVLRTDRRSLHIPLFVTVGCPLAVRAIRNQLVPLSFPKPSVNGWNNALDPRDIVALNPLDGANFPVRPAVLNYDNVKNHTDNRHGIDGYLDDLTVAGWVLDALA